VIDWDLEAPGLHRFFPNSVTVPATGVSSTPGVIDLFIRLEETTRSLESTAELEGQERTLTMLEQLRFDEYIRPAGISDLSNLMIMEAGQGRQGYATKVNAFPWESFYKRAPWLIRMLADRLGQEFRYVLIDSRTGLTDISGICTMLLPEKLVTVFTPNEQSLAGVVDLVQRAIHYRRHSNDLRPLVVYPLPARIESTKPEQRELWRFGASDGSFLGYQPRFQDVLTQAYGLDQCVLQRYFDEVQIQHAPEYAYGEPIAVLRERSGDVLSLSKSYERFRDWLLRPQPPWEDEIVTEEAERTARLRAHFNEVAENEFARLTEEERGAVKRVALWLVGVREPSKRLVYTRRTLELTDFAQLGNAVVVKRLLDVGLVVLVPDEETSFYQFSDDAVISGWSRLSQWIEEDKEFVLWRSRLVLAIEEWERRERSDALLLGSTQLREARRWAKSRPADLTNADHAFIRRSWRVTVSQLVGRTVAIAIGAVVVLWAASLWLSRAPVLYVRGQVEDGMGHPVVSAHVTIDATNFSVRSNQDGSFNAKLIDVSPDSRLMLRVQHSKYQTFIQSYAVDSLTRNLINITLLPSEQEMQ
jgi:hypothetical protein